MKASHTVILFLIFVTFAASSREVRYEPENTTLHGVIRRQTFPGPPNYDDVTKGDKPETYWILELSEPIDVIGKEGDDLHAPERKVREIQLVFDGLSKKSYADYPDSLGKRVIVTGQLFHRHTGHHRTSVLISVRDIKKDPNKTVQRTGTSRSAQETNRASSAAGSRR